MRSGEDGDLEEAIPRDVFGRLAELVHERTGIVLGADKRGFVAMRLRGLPSRLGHPDVASLCREVVAQSDHPALPQIVDCLSTNHTFFYRESAHFDHFRDEALPETTRRLREREELDLRVWCAAASTGEEPYTLAMLLREHLGPDLPRWQAGLLATDISERALAVAREGVYREEDVARLPEVLRKRYFRPRGGGLLEVVPELRSDVVFRRFNLLAARYPFRKPFHVVFCRNVMIYFDAATRDAVAQRIFGCLAPGGYLYLGMAETLRGRHTPLEFVRPAVYRKAS